MWLGICSPGFCSPLARGGAPAEGLRQAAPGPEADVLPGGTVRWQRFLEATLGCPGVRQEGEENEGPVGAGEAGDGDAGGGFAGRHWMARRCGWRSNCHHGKLGWCASKPCQGERGAEKEIGKGGAHQI